LTILDNETIPDDVKAGMELVKRELDKALNKIYN
jgi:hypothetical protein